MQVRNPLALRDLPVRNDLLPRDLLEDKAMPGRGREAVDQITRG